jgi:catechol 2,3-dioxygenase-like lactoylglutathione lyase family enzyme
MKLGMSYLGLNVKDILKSKDFYESIGFKVFKGNIEEKWLIMKNDINLIGLFQGIYPQNALTFHPGWDADGKKLDSFHNIKELRKMFKKQKVNVIFDAGRFDPEYKTIILSDPDGNFIFFEQFV